jgi:hypothetical protein
VVAFAGTVEFGLDSQRRRLAELLEVIRSTQSIFVDGEVSRRARYVQPRLEARVRFIGRDAGVLREAILEHIQILAE